MWRAAVIAVVACSSRSAPAPSATGCGSDGDCVIACPGSCCQDACGSAMPRAAAQAPTRTCSQDDIASCPPPTHATAACRDHTCIAALPPPAKPTALDISTFSRACVADADCTLVELDPCNACACTDVPISAKDSSRYAAAFRTVHCPAAISVSPCVHCDATVAYCDRGTCAARSVEVQPADGECHSDADCVISCTTERHCCEPSGCETVVPKSRADAIQAACRPEELAACPNVGKPDYIKPVCKAGQCFAKLLPR